MSRITDDIGVTSVQRKSLVSSQLCIGRRSEGSGPGDVVAAGHWRENHIGMRRDVSTGEGNNRLREYHR